MKLTYSIYYSKWMDTDDLASYFTDLSLSTIFNAVSNVTIYEE